MIMNIDTENLRELAESRFKEMFGMFSNQNNDDKIQKIKIKQYERAKEILDKRKIKVLGIECKKKISTNQIIYYLLSIKKETDSDNSINELYNNMWNTAFLDATRIKIYEELMKKYGGKLVPKVFGPGYDGMSMKEMNTFYEILHGEKIGVYLNEQGMLIPESSCMFMYIIDDTEKIIDNMSVERNEICYSDIRSLYLKKDICKECKNRNKNCEFCIYHIASDSRI